MRLKYLFETVDMGDEIVAVPVGKDADQVKGVLKINREAKEIMDILANETTEIDLIDLLKGKYETSAETITTFVREFIQELRDAGFMNE